MSLKKKTEYFYNDPLILKSQQQSSFRAVKNLIEAQNNIETVKNRIKVLQLNEQRNMQKINLQKQQIERINQLRNQHIQQLAKLGVNKYERQRITEQIKKRNEEFRQKHKKNMALALEQISEQKAKQYQLVLQQSQLNDSIITQNKMKEIQKKQEKRNKVVERQEETRQNIFKFYQDKTKQIYSKNSRQVQLLNKKKRSRQKQLKEIANIEMEMIQRHSQSQMAYKQMKTKLDTMLCKIRDQKKRNNRQMKCSVHRQVQSTSGTRIR